MGSWEMSDIQTYAGAEPEVESPAIRLDTTWRERRAESPMKIYLRFQRSKGWVPMRALKLPVVGLHPRTGS